MNVFLQGYGTPYYTQISKDIKNVEIVKLVNLEDVFSLASYTIATSKESEHDIINFGISKQPDSCEECIVPAILEQLIKQITNLSEVLMVRMSESSDKTSLLLGK
ncbi:hypothetical protein KM043_013181 [Ampulex compressa]|nr:hypothetical protein KM043_013181 [Ampulex compressa]